MVVLRQHFQVTGHKNPILSAASHAELLVTAELGNIRLWSYKSSHAESGGPALLRTIACPQQPILALFTTPDSSHVVVVLPEDVIMFNVHEDSNRPKVLLHLSETTDKCILAAAWCRDVSSLALATSAGIKIYKLLPFRSDTATSDGTQPRASPTWPCTLALELLHNITAKGPLSTRKRDGRKRMGQTWVDSLATDDSTADTKAGAALLVGIAGGEELCVWDMVTGSLLAASVVTADGCEVERIAWHGPTAMSALLYSLDGRLKRVDLHQINFERQTTTLIFSFVSDISIAGFNFSAAPTTKNVATSFPTKNVASTHRPTSQVYIHIVDRRRTLRTWLFHPGGVNAVVAYALPTAAPQVAMIHETNDPKNKANNDGIGNGIGEVESPVTAQESNEEVTLDPSTTALATRAFVAYVFPSQLQRKAGPGILVVAGLTISGISFLPEGDTVPMGHIESPIWKTSEMGGRLSDGHQEDPGVPRVLGMRGIFSNIGNRQALAVMWSKRPCFQVLDVSRVGFSTQVQEILMDRRHRDDQLIDNPRFDRSCYITSWAHSTALETLLCGWNDGVVDVVSPRTRGRQIRLFQPGSTYTPATSLASIPLAVILSQTSTQVLSDPAFPLHDVAGVRQGLDGVIVLVGGADGTLALWPICRASRPWHIVFAHNDAVVAVRSAMDIPQDFGGCRVVPTASPASKRVLGGNKDCLSGVGRPFTENPIDFVLTAGANREVKVWGIDDAGKQGVPPLSLRGYTVVGGTGENDCLTALELLSEGSMVCGFLSGAVEVWLIPFTARDGILATTREALQAFPSTHEGEVTSIAVSVGLRYRAQDSGGEGVGRVVLTTSADCSVVRWASTAPGPSDRMEPMTRYCLSREPSSAALLPPPAEFLPSGSIPKVRQELRFGREATATSTELFRVVAALDGLISVLELAPAGSLIGGRGIRQNLHGAVSNAFPGTPLVQQLYLHPPGTGSETVRAPNRLRWGVGGITGREAGWYDEFDRIKTFPPEWEILGGRRLAAAKASRDAWEYCAYQLSDHKTQNEKNRHISPFSAHDGVRRNARVFSSKKHGANRAGGMKALVAKRRTTMKPHVNTLIISPDERGTYTEGAQVHACLGVEDASLLKTLGGKVVKIDKRFTVKAERQRESQQNSKTSTSVVEDTTNGAVVQCTNDIVTIDLTLLTHGPSHQGQSAASESSGSLVIETNRSSANSASFGSISAAESMESKRGVKEDVPSGGLIVAGEPSVSRHPPLLVNDSHERLGVEASDALLDPTMGSESPLKAKEGTRLGTGGTEAPGRLITSIGTMAAHEERKTCETEMGNSKKKQKSATVAVNTTREAGNEQESLQAPAFMRQPSLQERRHQFKFDSAQSPYSGMLGVGVAVPMGYADKRLQAAKQRFTPLTEIGPAGKRRSTPMRKGKRIKSGNEDASKEGSEEEEGRAPKIEPFPTGLVVSKHFTENRSGREILMLEVSTQNISWKENDELRSSDRGNWAATASDSAYASKYVNVSAAAAATAGANLAALSPRSRSLKEVFYSLSAGKTVLSRNALQKWDYVSRSIERGLIPQHQVSTLFWRAHGGRNRGKMVWQDMVFFYEGMEAALDKACAPPLVEKIVVDFEGWDSISALLHLTKSGKVYLVAVEAADERSPAPAPSPLTIREGGSRGRDAKIDNNTRSVAAWVTASVPNPYVSLRLTLTGLLPENNYELFAYAENEEGGRLGGARWGSGENVNVMFSLDPIPSGMSADLVKATRVAVKTAPEPAEELDIPWEYLSEGEKRTEALAALGDPVVKRAIREMAFDAPTAVDLKRIETDAISRNKWKHFCRWWTFGEGWEERRAFLFRECVFAAQQPEVLEEAARMGVHILEGDWNAALEPTTTTSSTNATIASSAQRRWTAFRSWYRGGRGFDRAPEALIKSIVKEHWPHSTSNADSKDLPELSVVTEGGMEFPSLSIGNLSGCVRPDGDERAAPEIPRRNTVPETVIEGIRCALPPKPSPPPPPPPTLLVVDLDGGNRSSGCMPNPVDLDLKQNALSKLESSCSEAIHLSITEGGRTSAWDDTDAAKSSEIVDWEGNEEAGAEFLGINRGLSLGTIVEGLITSTREKQTTAAKKLRMDARRRFLAARTILSKEAASKVGHLLDVMREDMKSKRAIERASGVIRPRPEPRTKRRKHGRKQTKRELALKRAEELLNKSQKVADILKRKGSLRTVRPEDVASIGVFDNFNIEEFEPEQPDPDLLCRTSTSVGSRQAESIFSTAEKVAAWAPRSPDELTLELQLACVQPRVCSLAASAGIGVPDPEDSFTTLLHRKDRWETFSAWYYPPPSGGPAFPTPQRQALLGGEVSAAAADETIRIGMREEDILIDGGNFDVHEFVEWYCENDADLRQDFRRRRVDELLQARRLIVTEVLGYIPSPFLFRVIPPLLPLPSLQSVERFQLYASRSPEAYSWADVSKWYDQNDLEEDDELMKAAEHAGQLASLLAASQEEESNYEALERRVARWEDFRSHLMRESEKALSHNPSGIGTGGWLYHYTLPSWRGLKLLGFEEGSGLDNDDEVFDALEVARKEIQEEKKRIAEVRRLREIAKQKRLAEERHRREEQRRLCWMRETEEKRRLVQQHMADLKRQRALEAEIKQMAREEALALALMREEKRLAKHRLAKEAALTEERRSKELAAEAKPAELAQAQCLQNAEISAKEREDERSRQLEAEKRAAEMASREREAYLQELYTPFTPLWGWMWNTLSSEEDQFGEGSEDGGGGGSRPTAWWQGADVPQIWEGPRTPYRSTSKQRERPRLTPNADTDIDGLNIQTGSVGKMTREVLTLLGLPRESVRDMYEQGKRTVRDTDAVVESIQLGRIFTMFEDDQVRNNLIPAVPLERLETRVINKISGKRQTAPRQYHRQAIVPGENFFRRSHGRRLSSHGVPLLTALDGRSPRNNWGGIRTSGSHRSLREGGEGCATLLEKEWGRNIEGFGDDYVAGLTLSGDKATLSETDSQERMHGRRAGSMSMPIAKNLGPEIKPSLSAMSLKAITKQKPGLTPTVSVSCKTSGETQNYPRAPVQSSSSSKRIGASSRKELLPLSSHQQRRGLGWTGSRKKSFSRKKTQSI